MATRIPINPPDAQHGPIQGQPQAQVADVGSEDPRDPAGGLGGKLVVVGIEPLHQVPRLLQSEDAIQPQDLELDELHPAVAGDEVHETGDGGRDGEETRLEHSAGSVARVEGVDHDTAGASFREGELFVIDEAALHRECDQHAEDGNDDVPDDHLPPRNDLAGDEHVGRHAGDERGDHVARGGGDGLGAVVFEQGEVAPQGRLLQ